MARLAKTCPCLLVLLVLLAAHCGLAATDDSYESLFDEAVRRAYSFSSELRGPPRPPAAVAHVVQVTRAVGVPILRRGPLPVLRAVPVPAVVHRPFPVHVPVPHPIAVPIIRAQTITADRLVDRPYRVHFERKIRMPFYRPYPVPVPIVQYVHRERHHSEHHHEWE